MFWVGPAVLEPLPDDIRTGVYFLTVLNAKHVAGQKCWGLVLFFIPFGGYK